tara:strand:+ start:352 stop:480 length:129 start_codon:yes stop_codon:yes gene_type:complete
MIEFILEIPMELKVIIGSGIIMGLLQYGKIRYGKNNNKKITD